MYRIMHNGKLVVTNLEIADTFWSRFMGLMATDALPQNQGLLIRPCSCVHTFGMHYPIDVAFLSGNGQVLNGVNTLLPGRIRLEPAAFQVLELAAGELQRLGIGTSSRLQIQWHDGIINHV